MSHAPPVLQADGGPLDLRLVGARVLEGVPGEPPRAADVGVRDGKIVAVDDLSDLSSARTVDVTGRWIVPGFVDVHTHAERPLLTDGPHRLGPATMGVTTVLSGADGFGWVGSTGATADALWASTAFCHGDVPRPEREHLASPAAYVASLRAASPLGIVVQAPHQAIRAAVVGFSPRAATAEERRAMQRMLEAWFDAGAVGLATGLDYAPALSSDAAEMRALAGVVAAAGGVIAAHLRYTTLGREAAWRELLDLHRATGARVHVSHEVVDDVTRPILDEAQTHGDDVTFEAYLYPAGCTHLAMTLPEDVQRLGPDGMRVALQDRDARQRTVLHLEQALRAAVARGERIVVVATPGGGDVGVDLTAAALGDARAAADRAVSMAEEHHPYALCLYHRGWSDDLRERIFDDTAVHPRMLVASDGVYHGSRGHPRGYGTFTRFWRRQVVDRALLDPGAAVFRMAGGPAQRFGMTDRGFVRPGMRADLLVIDPDAMADTSTWEQPFTTSVGLDAVWVEGRQVLPPGDG